MDTYRLTAWLLAGSAAVLLALFVAGAISRFRRRYDDDVGLDILAGPQPYIARSPILDEIEWC